MVAVSKGGTDREVMEALAELSLAIGAAAEAATTADTVDRCRRSLELTEAMPTTAVESSTAWKFAGTATPPTGWHEPGFDDSVYSNADWQ